MQNTINYNQPQNQLMGDSLKNLPSDKVMPSHTEINIIDTLFKHKKSTLERMMGGVKNILILGLLFILFSLPQLDTLLQTWIKITATSPYILIVVKAILFMVVYFCIENFYLVRNK